MKSFKTFLEEEEHIPFDHDPKVGWWKDQKHLTVYHGTHDRNVASIKKNGISHMDPRTKMLSVTHDPHTAHGYASMSSAGGEHHFRSASGNAAQTPHEHRSVVKMKIPMKWAEKHMDHNLRGNIGGAHGKMSDKSQYEKHKASGRPDHEYYATTEVRLKKAVPAKFIVGVMKKTKSSTSG